MASKTATTLALFLAINLVLLNLTAATYPTCSMDSTKIMACGNVLNLVNLSVGSSAFQPCCTLINGLQLDLEAAVCLCSSLKLSVLGITLNTNAQISLILNACGGRTLPSGFNCAA